MSAISGTRRSMKELVDGTIRVQIDIDPKHNADFHALFPRIDMPVALAPLVANFEQIKPARGVEPTVDTPDKPKGGELAKWAGILSNDPVFWEWANETDGNDYSPIIGTIDAARYIREQCCVESRAELDHNPEAAKIFRHMMGEFDDWKNGGKAA